MDRRVKYLFRPQLYAITKEQQRLGIPDNHDHPAWKEIPSKDRLVIIFAHPATSIGCMKSLVLWERKGIGFWVDIPFSISKRLPSFLAEGWRYRLG